jgi:hypothetical protein
LTFWPIQRILLPERPPQKAEQNLVAETIRFSFYFIKQSQEALLATTPRSKDVARREFE